MEDAILGDEMLEDGEVEGGREEIAMREAIAMRKGAGLLMQLRTH